MQIGALSAIFSFMLIRPQRRQQEKHRQLLASLQRGDRIVTSGGIIGEVVHLKDDEVTVKSAESRLIVQRANIANILNRSVEVAKPRGPSSRPTCPALPGQGSDRGHRPC